MKKEQDKKQDKKLEPLYDRYRQLSNGMMKDTVTGLVMEPFGYDLDDYPPDLPKSNH